MTRVKGGGALPVRQNTTGPVQGGPAKRVYGYTAAPGDRPAIGGPAQPVRVLTDADLRANGGDYVLDGDPVAMPIYDAPAGARVVGGPALAVYPVNGWPEVPITYLLRDLFLTDRAAGAVNGTAAEPGPGTRTVIDTNGVLSITGGVLDIATGGAGGNGDPGYWLNSISRVFGRTLLMRLKEGVGSSVFSAGWDSNQTTALVNHLFLSGTALRCEGNLSSQNVAVIAADTWYDLAYVLRASGCYYFIKGGAFTHWTLVFVTVTSNTASMFPAAIANSSTAFFQADNIRVPDRLYSVPCLAYDTFTRANGALGNSETSGPDGQAVAARAWTGATFAVASNVAVNTPSVGSELIVNGGFTGGGTGWSTEGSGWSFAGDVAVATDATGNIVQSVGELGHWYQITYTIVSRTGGAFQKKFGSGFVGPVHTAVATYTETGVVATTTGVGIAISGVTNGTVDDVSLKELALSELFASLQSSVADVLADVNVTGPTATVGRQAGLVLNLDSAATPANFVIAYLDGAGNARLDKYVAGTRTSVISAAVTYSAGATLRVIKDGTSYRLFYNGAAVGSVSTISDAGIVDNTLHGLFSTSPLNSADHFCVMPVGSNNEFAGLDAF